MNLAERIALLDMDGTVADYDTRMREWESKIRDPNEPLYPSWGDVPPHIEARRDMIRSVPGFWSGLPRIDAGFDLVDMLEQRNLQIHVLTKGPKRCLSAWTEKASWCQTHLKAEHHVTVTQGAKANTFGRVLVDDFPPYFEAWLETRPRGLVITVAQEWNADYAPDGSKARDNVIRYDRSVRSALAVDRALQRAADRQPNAHVRYQD